MTDRDRGFGMCKNACGRWADLGSSQCARCWEKDAERSEAPSSVSESGARVPSEEPTPEPVEFRLFAAAIAAAERQPFYPVTMTVDEAKRLLATARQGLADSERLDEERRQSRAVEAKMLERIENARRALDGGNHCFDSLEEAVAAVVKDRDTLRRQHLKTEEPR